MSMKANEISASISGKTIIEHISLQVEKGQFVGVIGPNGSGKSTLLKSMYRLNKPDCGLITLDDENIYALSAKQTAKKLAVVSQETAHTFEFSVKEIVAMGRAPHKKMMELHSRQDEAIVHEALEKVGLAGYEERLISTLSGGEKQRTVVARALAQQADYLVLDEPTNHLDIHYQLQLMDLVKSLGTTVIAALHDLNIASVYCDYLYVLKKGKIAAHGTPDEVLTEQLLEDIFDVKTNIIRHPLTDKPHITFLSNYMLLNR